MKALTKFEIESLRRIGAMEVGSKTPEDLEHVTRALVEKDYLIVTGTRGVDFVQLSDDGLAFLEANPPKPMTNEEVLAALKRAEAILDSIRWDEDSGHQHNAYGFLHTCRGAPESVMQAIGQLEPEE